MGRNIASRARVPRLVPGSANGWVLVVADQLVVAEELSSLEGQEKAGGTTSNVEDAKFPRLRVETVLQIDLWAFGFNASNHLV